MTKDINRIELCGRVGGIRLTDADGMTARASLSTSVFTGGHDRVPVIETMWHNLVLNQNLSEVDLRDIRTDDRLHVTGILRVLKYTNVDGLESVRHEVLVTGCRRDEEQEE